MTFDLARDPLPTARDAIDCKGTLPCEDVVFLARALIEAHAKVDQLYATLEKRSDATRDVVEKVLSDTARWAPSTASCRDLRQALRDALDRGPVFAEHSDQRRLDWLDASQDRLLDAHGRMNNESVALREAIDWLMVAHKQETT